MPKKVTIEDLARITKSGFDDIAKTMNNRFTEVDKRFDKLELRMDKFELRMAHLEAKIAHVEARIAQIEKDVAEIRKELISRVELEDLMARVKYLELKLGIKSGK